MYLPVLNDSTKNKESQFDKEQITDFFMVNSTFT
jgi:hypothetical protein